jgi:N6-adenosine-specific RNA methylase IME4/ParB-like chromosome segregation protein Spo0J
MGLRAAHRASKRLKPHPAADLFPMMGEAELNELAADIRQRGQLEPIIVITTGKEDLILDGRNRYEACRRAEVEPYLLTWDQELDPTASPTAFVLSKNLHRRHLNESQRGLIGAEAEPLFAAEAKKRMSAGGKAKGKGAPRGAPLEPPEPPQSAKKPARASEAAAKAVGASPRSVERAKSVLKKRPELRDQIRAAKITLKQAEKAIRKEEQIKNVLEYRPPVGTYAVIVADVPWEYEDQLDGSDQVRGGTGYPTMPLEEILKIKPPAAPDCALWFWTTNAFLIDGIAAHVVKVWGFEAKALYTWRKVDKNGNDRLGSGHYGRNVTEHVILAVRGKPVIDGSGQPNIFDAPRTSRHSEKPDRAFEIAEKVTPCAPEARIELFAVEERKGWVTSGSEQQAKGRAGRRDAHERADEVEPAGPIIWKPKKHPSIIAVGEAKDRRFTIETNRKRNTSIASNKPGGKKIDGHNYFWRCEGSSSSLFDDETTAKTDAAQWELLQQSAELTDQHRHWPPTISESPPAPVDDGTLCGVRPSKNGDSCILKQHHDGVHSNGRTTWRDRKGKLPAIEEVTEAGG